MNFRDLTNQEIEINRKWLPEESRRTEFEARMLQTLQDDITAFLGRGGSITMLPAQSMSEPTVRGSKWLTTEQKAAIEKRIRESGGVVR